MSRDERSKFFRLFNEIGIIEQLSRTMFEAHMPLDLLVSHFAVINHLIRVEDGRTPLELANAFQVPKTTMTYTLSGLEKHGLVAMRPNPKDGRSKCVWLTPAGRAFRDDAIAALNPELDRLMPELKLADVDTLISDLTQLRVKLDELRNG